MGPYSFYCAGYAGLAFDGNYANEENYTAYAVGVADAKSQHYLKSRAALLEEVAQQLAACGVASYWRSSDRARP